MKLHFHFQVDFILPRTKLPVTGSSMKRREPSFSRPVPSGSRWKPSEKYQKMEAVFQPAFFLLILINFLSVPLGINQKRSEMIMKNYGRNTASTKSPEGSGNGQFLVGFLDLGLIREKVLLRRLVALYDC